MESVAEPVPSHTPSIDEDLSHDSPASRRFAAGDVIISTEPWIWSFQYMYHKMLCAQCFTESDCLRACSNCKLYRYCDAKCQSTNWKKEHKKECEMLKTIQIKILKQERSFDHDCMVQRCPYFGCCSGEILVAKLINKITNGHREKIPGFDKKMNAMEFMDTLPVDPFNRNFFGIWLDNDMCSLAWPWPKDSVKGILNFEALVNKLCYNSFFIVDQRGKSRPGQAIGLFPQALHRSMTPVCLDINVTIDFQGRTMKVRATEEITNYTGLADLRHNELAYKNLQVGVEERALYFRMFYGRACECRKCSKEYIAQINPLVCATQGCSARIPSDSEAYRPCPQCGANNGDRMRKLIAVETQFYDITYTTPEEQKSAVITAKWTKVMEELGDLLHPDAHFRLVCGFDLADCLFRDGHYEKAWNLCGVEGMVTCVRALYPTYHVGRARTLVKYGAMAYIWYRIVQDAGGREEERLRSFFDATRPKALGWLEEAQKIYKKLGGSKSQWAREVGSFIFNYVPGKRIIQVGNVVIASEWGPYSYWNWNDPWSVYNW